MSGSSYTPKKIFTVEQANKMLPLVRRIAEDISAAYHRLVTQYRLYQDLAAERNESSDPARLEEFQAMRDRVEQDKQAIVGFARELDDLGIVLKGEAEGLVDFPCIMNGRVVFLCWKLGEGEIKFWHEIEDGYRGRQPLYAGAATDEGSDLFESK